MYKILIKIRDTADKKLYETYTTTEDVVTTDAVIDETTGDTIEPAVTEERIVDWTCDALAELETKVDELLDSYPITAIVPYKVIDIDAIVSATDGEIIGG